MPDAVRLFLSYSSCDSDKVRSVHRYLAGRGISTFFDQQNLRAGRNWPQALEQQLRDSSAVAVFVGPQIGNWQWPEIGFSLDRQANEKDFPVVPILLDGADTSRSFLFLNTWVDLRGERLDDVEALNRLIDAVSDRDGSAAGSFTEFNPFRGLEVFDEMHAPFFFGRERFIEDLVARLTQQHRKFVAVVGASGSGKSSVVRAGLIPRLRRQRPPRETWDVAVFTPGERPWFRLADALGTLRFPEKSGTDLDIEVDKLALALRSGELRLESLLDRILQPQGRLHRLLLVVDQFEELFTLAPVAERSKFVECLVDSLSVEGLVLVPTLRADLYGQAIEINRRLSDLLGQGQVTLGRLTPEELARAVIEPARLARLEFDPGLPELLLRDAGNEPGNLPLLQHALLELYDQRSGNRLTSAAYQAIGGIRKAIANSAEREFRRFQDQGQGDTLRRVFTQLVRLARADEGLEDTRRRVATTALPGDAQAIVDELAGHRLRLLVKASERVGAAGGGPSSGRSEQETVEVAHEALIREWDRLKSWLNEDRGFYLWRQRLDQAIKDSEEAGGTEESLLQGYALKEAEGKLAAPMPEPLTPRQKEFIQASLSERDRREHEARAEKEQAQQRERDALAQAAQEERKAKEAAEAARRAERQRRRAADRAKRISWVAAGILLGITVFAGLEYRDARYQRNLITAQTLATRANELEARGDRIGASLLAALSLQIQPTQQARRFATSVLSGHVFRDRPLTGHLDSVQSAVFSPDGTRIVSGSKDRTLRLWDAQSGQAIGEPMRGHDGAVTAVAFSPDGTRIVSGSADSTLRLWDAKSGRPIGEPLRGHKDGVYSVAFNASGTLIVSASKDQSLRLWDAGTGLPVGAPLLGHEGEVFSVAFSHDGRLIASGGADGKLRLWDTKTGRSIGEPMHNAWGDVRSVVFSPDDLLIACSSFDGTVRLWDAKRRVETGPPLRGHVGEVWSVAFSPDGTRIISAGNDRTLRLWDLKSGRPIGEPLRGHKDAVWSASFSPDGRRILSGGADARLRLWDAKNGRPIREPFEGHEGFVTAVAFSPDGASIASSSFDGTVRLWDAKSGQPLTDPLRGHESLVTCVAFSPDGKRIASGGVDKTVRLWDARSGSPIGSPLRGHDDEVWSVAFSPDGSRIVSGSNDKTLRLWDPATGQPVGQPIRGHEHYIWAAVFSPDGTRIVSASEDDTVRIWLANSGQQLGEPLRGHTGWVTSVAFSPDGARIVSGSFDRTLRLWDSKSGQPIGEPLSGHEAEVMSVAFSPDGTKIASASSDRTLRLWDAGSGQPIGEPLRGHRDKIFSVAFSPKSEQLASGSTDRSIRLWDLRVAEAGNGLDAVLCQAAPRNLSRGEWKQYVPEGQKYRAVCSGLPLAP